MVLDCVKIVSEMKRQRLTSMDLANKAVCGLSTVQSARNERSISTNSARRIAAALGVPLDELMESEVQRCTASSINCVCGLQSVR